MGEGDEKMLSGCVEVEGPAPVCLWCSEDSGSKGQRWRPVTPEPGQFSPLLPPPFPLPTLQPLWSSPWPCSPRGRLSAQHLIGWPRQPGS